MCVFNQTLGSTGVVVMDPATEDSMSLVVAKHCSSIFL